MAIVTPILTKFVFAPIFRRWIEHTFAKYDHLSNITLMVLVLSAFITIAAYAGTSVLFGAFLAGTFLTYLPSKHPDGPFVVMSREEGEREADKSPTFVHTFERYLLDVQKYLMEPLFFASVGFAIPFLKLWTGKRIWRGIVYSLLMAFAKVNYPSSFDGMRESKIRILCSSLLGYGFPSGKLCIPSPHQRVRLSANKEIPLAERASHQASKKRSKTMVQHRSPVFFLARRW